MGNTLSLLHFSADTAAETEAAIETIVTGYGDLKVPVFTMIITVVATVLMLAFAVVSMMFLMKRGKNWGYAIMVGMLVYMLANYILYIGTSFMISKIPGAEEFFTGRPALLSVLIALLTCIYEVVCLLIGMKFIFNTNAKRNQQFDVISAFMIGIGFYVMCILLGNNLMYSYEFVTVSVNINKMGFDPAVTMLVQGGTEQEEAVQAVLDLVNTDPWKFLVDSVSFMLKAITVVAAGVAVYGVMKEKLESKWYLAAAGITAASFIPSTVATVFNMPYVVSILLLFVIAAASAYVVYIMLTKYMPEELVVLKTKVERKGRMQKEEPKKMPKINMPK